MTESIIDQVVGEGLVDKIAALGFSPFFTYVHEIADKLKFSVKKSVVKFDNSEKSNIIFNKTDVP